MPTLLENIARGTLRDPANPLPALTARHWAWLSLFAAAALSAWGVYAIDVAMRPVAEGAPSPLAVKHAALSCAGLLLAAIAAFPHYRLLAYLAWPALLGALALLVFLLIPMVPASIVSPRNGTRAWIDLGAFDLQPSEPAKVAYVMVLAHYLRFRRNYRRLAGLLMPGLITIAPVGLITLQPDLGTALLFVPACFATLFAAGARRRHLMVVVAAGALAAPAAFPLLRPYQRERIVALFEHARGEDQRADEINYQPLTAQRLAGSGGLSGADDAHARALIRFNPLPERHNDMIAAVVMARGGLVAGLALLGLYLLWIAGGLLAAAACHDPFGRLLCVGLSAFVAAQMFISVGMNVGLVPVIGITLPFVSSGGSSLLTAWMMTGLVFNVATRRPIPPMRPSFEHH